MIISRMVLKTRMKVLQKTCKKPLKTGSAKNRVIPRNILAWHPPAAIGRCVVWKWNRPHHLPQHPSPNTFLLGVWENVKAAWQRKHIKPLLRAIHEPFCSRPIKKWCWWNRLNNLNFWVNWALQKSIKWIQILIRGYSAWLLWG